MTAVLPGDPLTTYAIVSAVVATAEHSEEVLEVRWDLRADATRVSVGDRFTAHNGLRGMRWSSTSTVTHAEPGRRFAFAVNGPEHPTATWTFDLEPHGAGTRVDHTVVLGDGPSMIPPVAGGDPRRRAEVVAVRLDALAEATRP